MTDPDIISVGEFIKRASITRKTLLVYEQAGLIKSQEGLSQRHYDVSLLPIVAKIKSFQSLGISLNTINRIINKKLSDEAVKNIVLYKVRENFFLTHWNLRSLKLEVFPMEKHGDFVVKSIEGFQYVSFKTNFTSIHEVTQYYFKRVYKELIFCEHVPNVYYDCCFEINEQKQMKVYLPTLQLGSVESKILIVGIMPQISKAACMKHYGAFESIDTTKSLLLKEIQMQGYKAIGSVRYCLLLARPWENNYGDYAIEIQIPIENIPNN